MQTILSIKVLPGKNESKVINILENGTIKISIKAKAKEGEANRELIRLLSKKLNIPSKNIEIITGIHSRNKLISVSALEKEFIYKCLI